MMPSDTRSATRLLTVAGLRPASTPISCRVIGPPRKTCQSALDRLLRRRSRTVVVLEPAISYLAIDADNVQTRIVHDVEEVGGRAPSRQRPESTVTTRRWKDMIKPVRGARWYLVRRYLGLAAALAAASYGMATLGPATAGAATTATAHRVPAAQRLTGEPNFGPNVY